MSKLSSSRIMSSGLFAVLAAGALGSAVGCSKPEEEKKAAWSCTSDEVPMGEVVRCSAAAITSDGPVGGTADGTGGLDPDLTTKTVGGTTLDGITTGGTYTGGTR